MTVAPRHILLLLVTAGAVAAWAARTQPGDHIQAPPVPADTTLSHMNHQRVILGAGCFWGIESTFAKIPGVVRARVGYSGGHTPEPTYEKVCAHGTGHAEVVEIEYDPARVSFEQLLRTFWKSHDPSARHRLGPEDGSQYRSAIFFTTDEQERIARTSAASQPSVPNTEIAKARVFYPAEEYHQQYYQKQGIAGCKVP